MPNANTITRLVGANSPAQGTNAIPALVLTSTTETVFTNQLGNAAVLNMLPGGTPVAATAAPSFGVGFDGFPFRVRAVGKATTTNTSTVTLKLYQGSSTTVGSDTAVAAPTGQSLATASSNFILEATFIWDGVSKTVNGYFFQLLNNVLTSLTNTTQLTSITAVSSLQFVLSATSSAAAGGSATTITLTEFVVEAL